MDRNFVLASALSLAVLVGWMYLTGGTNRDQEMGVKPPEQPEAID